MHVSLSMEMNDPHLYWKYLPFRGRLGQLFDALRVIFLYTDFGSADLYVGQVKALLAQAAPSVPVIDVLNDVPRFQIEPAARLLAALARYLPRGSVTLCCNGASAADRLGARVGMRIARGALSDRSS